MCTFCHSSEMPTGNSKENKKSQFISWFPKPLDELGDTARYRMRLLFFRQPSKNNRKDAYLSQKIHDHWGETSNGKKIVDDIVICPGTKYSTYDEDKFVLNEKTGKKEINCPICKKASEAYGAWKASGYKDKVAMKRYNALKSKFRAAVPIFLINDPLNEKNNKRMKVLVFTNKDEFDRFDAIVKEEIQKAYISTKEGKPYDVFNGENGVDFYLRMETVDEVRNQGKPNEYTAKVRKITQMAFGTKAYSIAEINKDAIDSFEFDEQFYISNTKDEINAFYKKYYGHDETEIPDEEVDVFAKSKPLNTIATANEPKKTEVVSDESLLTDPDDLPPNQPSSSDGDEEDSDDIDIESDESLNNMIDELDL